MVQTNTTAARRPRITVIDPRKPEAAKLRVAAYARVSSDSADQLNSYMAQVDFYTKFISSREDWELVDVYADGPVKIGLNQQHPTARGALV